MAFGVPLFVPFDTSKNAPQLTVKGVRVVINDCPFPEDGPINTHTYVCITILWSTILRLIHLLAHNSNLNQLHP